MAGEYEEAPHTQIRADGKRYPTGTGPDSRNPNAQTVAVEMNLEPLLERLDRPIGLHMDESLSVTVDNFDDLADSLSEVEFHHHHTVSGFDGILDMLDEMEGNQVTHNNTVITIVGRLGLKKITAIFDGLKGILHGNGSSDPTPEPDPSGRHVVQQGDNFWSIATKVVTERLGSEPNDAQIREYWLELIEANRNFFENPNLITPGQVFILP